MTKRKSKSLPSKALRDRAIDQMTAKPAASRGTRSGSAHPETTLAEYRQELAIHQVELELQNEELRAARLELEAGLDRYTQLFDFAPIGYATLAADGTVRELNHVGASFLFENRSRLIGKRFGLFVAPSDRAAFNELLRVVLESDQKETCELRLRNLGDSQAVVRITAVTLAGAEPTILVAFEDITAQKLAEERLLRADLALREADRRKDEFLAVLSHELRTPLSTLLMYGQLLRQGTMDPNRVRVAAEAIERAARIQARLIDDLLDVSRIVAGKLSMQIDEVNLAAVARAALDAVAKEAERRRISIEYTFDAAVPLVSGGYGAPAAGHHEPFDQCHQVHAPGGQIRLKLKVLGDLRAHPGRGQRRRHRCDFLTPHLRAVLAGRPERDAQDRRARARALDRAIHHRGASRHDSGA